MKPERRSSSLLAITRSKAKMFEFGIPLEAHIEITRDPIRLMRLAIGMLGDVAGDLSGEERDEARTRDLLGSLRFAARYFDALEASGLADRNNAYLLLLAAATYYLCDMPGSAQVLVSRIPHSLELDAGGLERVLIRLLSGDFSSLGDERSLPTYGATANLIVRGLRDFYGLEPEAEATTLRGLGDLRTMARQHGSPRELLLADTCCAIARLRLHNSARASLPRYSHLSLESWRAALAKTSALRDLWPAQRRLGESGVFGGMSAVVQMPTSAGKSRAAELIIRSAFLSGRASLAVVVAPFRALCHEIHRALGFAFRAEAVQVEEVTDVLQDDLDVGELAYGQSVLVLTPEKLVYVLRHRPELATLIGLLVLDEAHQFDTGPRGVTYELLVTALNALVPATSQVVAISAVLVNSAQIASWLTGDEEAVVGGSDLLPTERSVAFTSWQSRFGQLQFVSPTDPERGEFFVPRILRSLPLARRGRERKERVFPARDDILSVALYLGITLAPNGAAAIFCGRKDSARLVCQKLIDARERDVDLRMPADVADGSEVARLSWLYERNLGGDAPASRASRLGAFTHHGNTPHGIRLCVEHAMKEGLGRLVVCTSTLAQGVNLPIRYLIVTSTQQGSDRIKVRDFHNLMGRAGRSGMHTEGTVIFADPSVYDRRGEEYSKWPEYRALLEIGNSEPCASTLLSLLEPLRADGGTTPTRSFDPIAFVQAYLRARTGGYAWIGSFAAGLAQPWSDSERIRQQLVGRQKILESAESFLLAHFDDLAQGDGGERDQLNGLVEGTLAYHLGSARQRRTLIEVFQLLAANIGRRVADAATRRVYARTLFGVADTIALADWVRENLDAIASSTDVDRMLNVLWPSIDARIHNATFQKLGSRSDRRGVARRWIRGRSFGSMIAPLIEDDLRLGSGARPRKLTVEDLVEIGENALGFEASHIVGAITELSELVSDDEEPNAEVLQLLRLLQKRLRYGLPDGVPLLVYEAGFADRVVALELAELLPGLSSRDELRDAMRERDPDVDELLSTWPSYFVQVAERLGGDAW